MPTYRAPGVVIEEIASGSRPIPPMATSTAAFIGTARKGPINKATLVTDFSQFEKRFGIPYRVIGDQTHYLAYSVRHFFEQGGSRCYVIRVAHYTDPNKSSTLQATPATQSFDGTAPNGAAVVGALKVDAISPGIWGRDLMVSVIPSSRFSLRLAADIPAAAVTEISLAPNDQVQVGSLLWIVDEVSGTIGSITAAGAITFDGPLRVGVPSSNFGGTIIPGLTVFGPGLSYLGKTSQLGAIPVVAGVPNPPDGIQVSPTKKADGTDLRPGDSLTFAMVEARIVVERVSAPQGPTPTTVAHITSTTFAAAFPASRSRVYARDFTLRVSQDKTILESHENLSLVNTNLADHVDTRLGATNGASQLVVAHDQGTTATDNLTFLNGSTQALTGGDDGLTNLGDADFAGSALLNTGLHALTPIRDAAILAIPNASLPVIKEAISYIERRGDLFLIIEKPLDFEGGLQSFRSGLSSKYVAIYHPWIEIPDPFTPRPLLVPPSGAVAGIYALTDTRRGVHKAPAGLDTGKVSVATGIETRFTKAEYDVLYQDEINLIFPLREGFHVWGSRTIASGADEEWRQVSVRRLFNFLEKSIENGTQWVTFEPNDLTLWKSIERNISAFLRIQWLEGKLVGATEKQAFFVHCNAETNPPEVVDAGQVVTVIGAAPSRPAEFVIFRIRQKVGQTAS